MMDPLSNTRMLPFPSKVGACWPAIVGGSSFQRIWLVFRQMRMTADVGRWSPSGTFLAPGHGHCCRGPKVPEAPGPLRCRPHGVEPNEQPTPLSLGDKAAWALVAPTEELGARRATGNKRLTLSAQRTRRAPVPGQRKQVPLSSC